MFRVTTLTSLTEVNSFGDENTRTLDCVSVELSVEEDALDDAIDEYARLESGAVDVEIPSLEDALLSPVDVDNTGVSIAEDVSLPMTLVVSAFADADVCRTESFVEDVVLMTKELVAEVDSVASAPTIDTSSEERESPNDATICEPPVAAERDVDANASGVDRDTDEVSVAEDTPSKELGLATAVDALGVSEADVAPSAAIVDALDVITISSSTTLIVSSVVRLAAELGVIEAMPVIESFVDEASVELAVVDEPPIAIEVELLLLA